MKMRLSAPVAARGPWLAVGRWAAGAVLLGATATACTGGGSSVPSIFTPTPPPATTSTAHPATRTPSPTGGQGSATGRATATVVPPPGKTTVTPAPTHTVSHSPVATPSPAASTVPPVTHAPLYPTAAPETGGGGTAGLQDSLLFGIGGAAVLAGLGSLALRRRLARRFAAGRPTAPRDPYDPADREPAKEARPR